MSTITKEWLLTTIAELEEERDATLGAVNEDAAMALAAMKLALESLEAEPGVNHQPVAWQYKEYVHVRGLGYLWREKLDCEFPGADCETLKDVVPLYIAPPAPVSVRDELYARIAELEAHKVALLKFVRDSCYVFDGADDDISDAYVDAITSGLMPKLKYESACNPPLFWVRVKSDGGYDGPVHDSKMEVVRKESGEWLPLTLTCRDVSVQHSWVSCRAAMLQGGK